MRQIEIVNDLETPVAVPQNNFTEGQEAPINEKLEYYKKKLDSYVYVDDFKAALEVAYNTGMNLINWGNGGHG